VAPRGGVDREGHRRDRALKRTRSQMREDHDGGSFKRRINLSVGSARLAPQRGAATTANLSR